MRLPNFLYFFNSVLLAGLLLGSKNAHATLDVNNVTENLIDSSVNLPGLVSVAAYLTGLALGVIGVLNLQKHVTMGPREMALRIPLIQLFVAGLLLALPYFYEVLIGTVQGTGGGFDLATASFYGAAGGEAIVMIVGGNAIPLGVPTAACADANMTGTVAGIFCEMWPRISNLPGLLSGFAYIAGLAMMYFGAINLKEAVENPGQTSLWAPLQKFVVAALLLVLPWTLEVVYSTLFAGLPNQGITSLRVNGTGTPDPTLDSIVGNFMFSLQGVMQFVFSGFGYIAGTVLIIIGIFRMMKTMQDGPRGPGGIGTIMTFVTGAGLLSLSPLLGAFSETLFDSSQTVTRVDLTVPGGGLVDYEERMENFISAVIAYMLILGWVSFIRGLFIFRGVAEGDQQASMMSAVTHLLGGALLVNLGPFLNAVQTTIGPVVGLPGLNFT